MSKLYAITNQKGGVGKSTTCVCLGAALTELGNRVLMVDLDPQAGLTTSLGQDPGAFERTIYDALIDDRVPVERVLDRFMF
ncbi:ParA family protein [Candidatus Poribacteria bacterium]